MQDTDDSRFFGVQKLLKRNGREDRHVTGTKDISPKSSNSGAGLCQHPHTEKIRSFRTARQKQGEYPVEAVLHDP